MAVDGNENFEPKDAVPPQTPRREPPVIEGKAEPLEETAGIPSGPDAFVPQAEAAGAGGAPAGALNPQPSPPPRKSGGVALPLSILTGAIIAAGGAFGLHYLDDSPAALAELEGRVNALSAKTDSFNGLSAKTDALASASRELQEKVAALSAAATASETPPETANAPLGEAQAGMLAGLEKRLAAAEANFAAAPKAAQEALAEPLADLDKRVAAAEAGAAEAAAASKAAAEAYAGPLAALEKRLAALEDSVSADVKTVAALKTDLQKTQDVQKAIAEKPPAPPVQVNLAPLDQRLSKMEQRLAPVESSLEGVKTGLHAVEEHEAATPPAQAQNAAIVASNLLLRAQQGLPYEPELSALANFNIDPAKLALLKTHAAAGVAPVRKLADQFNAIAPVLIKQSKKSLPGQSFLDRLASDAARLVRIERVGDSSGTDEESLVEKIEAALAQNDVEAAYGIWTQLPAEAKTASAAFGDAAKARLDVINAGNSIASEAIANLSKSKS